MPISAARALDVETTVFDVAVVGNGIIGRSVALELCRAGASCVIVGSTNAGAGWRAAAGILAPSIGERDPEVRAIFRRSLDLYPEFLERLRAFDPGLRLVEGLLEILPSADVGPLAPDSIFLDESEVRRHEPALLAPFGAMLHRRDAAADSERIVGALAKALATKPLVAEVQDDGAARVDVERSPASLTTKTGRTIRARSIVLAAGAWTANLGGLPRPVPVSPLKGQLIALDAGAALARPVMAGHTYLVPRGSNLIVGATQEDAGFDVQTTEQALSSLRAEAARSCPVLAQASLTRHWAGLRPATPDLLPIIGPEPLAPALIYACGHSRNGILLAPLTAVLVRSCIEHSASAQPVPARFQPGRFR